MGTNNDDIVKYIQKINSGKIKIDYKATSIRSNVTTNALLDRITKVISHNMHTEIPKWQVLNWLVQKAIDGIGEGKIVNPELCSLITELEREKQEHVRTKERELKYAVTVQSLHKQVIQLKKELGKL